MKNFTIVTTVFSLFIFAFVWSSCESDEPVAEKSPLYKITVPENAIPTRETERWLWVTNKQNQLVHTVKLSNNQTVDVEYPIDHAEGDTYAVTILSFYQDNESYYVNTYTKADAGEYTLRSNATFQRTSVGNFSLTINNAPSSGFSIVGRDLGNGGSLNRNGTILTGSILLAKNPGSLTCLFFPTPATTSPRFKKLTDVPVASNQILDYNDFVPMDIERHFTFPGAVYTSFSISAVETENNKPSFTYSLYSNQFFTGNKDLSLYFSNAIAPKVQTSISYATDKRVFSYSHLGDQLPTAFKQISAEIISCSAENNRISVSTSGTYDAAATTVIYWKDLDDVTWTWFHPNEQQTILERPVIPSEVLSNHPVLTENFNSPFTTLHDYTGDVSYNQFIQNSIRGSFFTTLSNEVSSVQNY